MSLIESRVLCTNTLMTTRFVGDMIAITYGRVKSDIGTKLHTTARVPVSHKHCNQDQGSAITSWIRGSTPVP
jgi:hypothetical protein